MNYYNVAEAKARLSEIVEEVSSGQEVVLTKRGKPVARVIAMGRTWSIPGAGEHDANINLTVLERDTWWKLTSGAEPGIGMNERYLPDTRVILWVVPSHTASLQESAT